MAGNAGAKLKEMLGRPSPDRDEIATYLNALSLAEQIGAARSLSGRGLQRALWRAVEGNDAITVEDLVPRDYHPMKPVVFHGKNSLPAFTEFQKICFRPRTSDSGSGSPGNVLWGYNETPIKRVIGPGYYVVHDTTGERLGGAAFDYRQVPPERLPGWPELRRNDVGLSKLVYNGTVDYMRRVAKQVFIGEATRGGRELDSYFVLVREM